MLSKSEYGFFYAIDSDMDIDIAVYHRESVCLTKTDLIAMLKLIEAEEAKDE
jgi:hypothetical protein